MIDWLIAILRNALSGRCGNVEQHLEKVDQETREVKHTLRNLQASSEAISLLIRRMREDGSFEDRAKYK